MGPPICLEPTFFQWRRDAACFSGVAALYRSVMFNAHSAAAVWASFAVELAIKWPAQGAGLTPLNSTREQALPNRKITN